MAASPSTILKRLEEMNPIVQFASTTNTAKWFKPANDVQLEGEMYKFRAKTAPATPARMTSYASARVGAMPPAQEMKYAAMAIFHTDLGVIQASIKYNEYDAARMKGKYAVVDYIREQRSDAIEDGARRFNATLYQGSSNLLGTISTIKNFDASLTALTGSAHTPAVIKVNGTIGGFVPGMVLQICDASDSGSTKRYVRVHDVGPSTFGPQFSGSRTAGEGPYIVVEPCDQYGADATTTWATGFTPAAGDYLVRSGELDTGIHGLPDWFDSSVDVYRNDAGALQDRELAGNGWMNPEVFDYTSGGNAVSFDVDVHFRDLENTVSYMAPVDGINGVDSSADGPAFKVGVALMSPELLSQATRDATPTQRVNFVAADSLSAATKKEWFGEVGFNGFVYKSIAGNIAFQGDTMCPKNTIWCIDPNSFFWVTGSMGGARNITWLKQDDNGSLFVRIADSTTNTGTKYWRAEGEFQIGLSCKHIRNNVCIKGVKSDV
jgi:hypothetical protein